MALVDFSQYSQEDLLTMKVSCFGADVYLQNKITNQILARFGYASERAALEAATEIMGELDAALGG